MDTEQARELLASERTRIERALEDLAPNDGDDESDPSEASDAGRELLDAELGEGLVEGLREELDAVERAEQRLTDGTYGVSVDSGVPIPDGRLEAIPWAERTAEEQARYDSAGG